MKRNRALIIERREIMMLHVSEIEIYYNKKYPTEEMKALTLGADGQASCKLVSRLIEQCFSEDRYIFKAQGLHENIALLKEVCSSSEKMEFNEGVNVLGYIKKYPEIIADVENLRILKRLLSEWVSTVYERRWLIIAPEKNKSCIWKALEKKNIVMIWISIIFGGLLIALLKIYRIHHIMNLFI